ncbi:putative malate dehydrogenase, NAD(P)-binding, partial [Serratia symbiotica str. Tucson]
MYLPVLICSLQSRRQVNYGRKE